MTLFDHTSELKGEHFHLISLTEDRISDEYIHWLNDPEVNRFLEARFSPQTRDTVCAFVRSFYGDVEKYLWGIYDALTRDMVGTVTLGSINYVHGTGEIGLMIGKRDYWGKKASNEAMALAIKFAFYHLKLRRVTGGSYALNHGMNFTFKRLGFTCEGKLRKACYMGPDLYVDTYRWGLLIEEWQELNRRG